ncbi:MAG: hypothetical protein D6722_25890 [Bacteroidetes bacterium]|nr:MAG: hypothetical protein D6722_25890 [Bacteroidota bacterium]
MSSSFPSASAQAILKRYSVHPTAGFLPARPPLRRLPGAFRAWEALARDLSARLQAGCLRPAVEALPILDPTPLHKLPALERAMLLLSLFAHGYLRSPEGPPLHTLPEALARPWLAVATRLGRPPVLAHASLVLQNWRLLDPAGPRHAHNLAPLQMFLGGQDEAWFYTLTVEIEARGAAALLPAARLRLALDAGDSKGAFQALTQLSVALRPLALSLQRMRERCEPEGFYHRIRPFLASLEAVHYQGVTPPVRSYPGGSAAQSSLLQSMDAILDVPHAEAAAGAYLLAMRQHMPPGHRAFIHWLETAPRARDWAQGRLAEARQACLEPLLAFRQAHLQIATQYITGPARAAGEGQTGTGGTAFIPFLKTVRNDTGKDLR